MKNKLVEKILCERYNKIYTKNCDCNSLIKEDADTLLKGLAFFGLADLPKSIYSMLFEPPAKQKEEEPAQAETRTVPQLRDPNQPGTKEPRMTKIKEFGSAEGSVISPS